MLIGLTLPDQTPLSLTCHTWGNPNPNRTLFCVHGLTRNGLDFEPLALAAAAQGFFVIAPDMPGRGQSPHLANSALYNNAVNASLCFQLLTHFGIRQVNWIGTSMGGLVAMILASQSPQIFRRLVLNDVGCVVTAASLKRIGSYVGESPVFKSYSEAEQLLRLRTQPFAIPAEQWTRFAEHSIEIAPQGYRLAYDPAIALALNTGEEPKDIELWPLWEKMRAIPTLLIRGEHSDLLTRETAQKMKESHPNLLLQEIAGAGHAPALMTDAEIHLILEFLN